MRPGHRRSRWGRVHPAGREGTADHPSLPVQAIKRLFNPALLAGIAGYSLVIWLGYFMLNRLAPDALTLDLLGRHLSVDHLHDRLMDKATAEPDAAKRGALLVQAEKTALADYPWIPLRFPAQTDLVAPGLKGWVANPRDLHRSRWLAK